MTFIDQHEGDSGQKKKLKNPNAPGNVNNETTAGNLDLDKQIETEDDYGTSVGLIGGQPKDAEGGLDISQYTGPTSKPSSEFDDPEAEYKMGPGNGLSKQKERVDIKRKKPDPGNNI